MKQYSLIILIGVINLLLAYYVTTSEDFSFRYR